MRKVKLGFCFVFFLLNFSVFAQYNVEELTGTWVIDVAASEKIASKEDIEYYFKGEFAEIFKTIEYEFFKEDNRQYFIRRRKPAGKPVVSSDKVYCNIYSMDLFHVGEKWYKILEFSKDKLVLEYRDDTGLHHFFVDKIVLKRKK